MTKRVTGKEQTHTGYTARHEKLLRRHARPGGSFAAATAYANDSNMSTPGVVDSVGVDVIWTSPFSLYSGTLDPATGFYICTDDTLFHLPAFQVSILAVSWVLTTFTDPGADTAIININHIPLCFGFGPALVERMRQWSGPYDFGGGDVWQVSEIDNFMVMPGLADPDVGFGMNFKSGATGVYGSVVINAASVADAPGTWGV